MDIAKCAECGERLPLLAVSPVCANCLNKRYTRVMVEREREAWDQARPKDVALSHSGTKLLHLVLAVDSTRTYCGLRASELKKRRRRVKPDNLPADLCTDCRSAWDHLQQVCALRVRA